MKTVIIICCIAVACISGYIFRLGIERIINDEVIILKGEPLSSLPNYSLYCFSSSIFMALMSILVLSYTLEMPL